MTLLMMLVYLGVIATVVWLVVSSLRQISAGVKDMAETLQRIERKIGSPNPPTPAHPDN
jgi:hypothetical protein